MPSSHAYRKQPLKGIFLTYHILRILLSFPWVVVKLLLPSLRQKSSWSYKRSFYVHFFQQSMKLLSPISGPYSNPRHLELDKTAGLNGVWVEPVPDLIVGEVKEWAIAASVKPMTIPGYWINKSGSTFTEGWRPNGRDKVVYFMHGGGYTRLSARPSDVTANIPKGLLESCPDIKRSFSIEYRLSVAAPFVVQNAFPAALLDALAGYNYLVNVMGYSPTKIIMVGDSAGGNLALALTRYLLNNPLPSLSVSSSIILLSPWVDMGAKSVDDPKSSFFRCAKTDYVDPRLLTDNYGVQAFTGHLLQSAPTNEYIAPASVLLPSISFKGFPRIFISAGGAEILLDQIRVLKNRMQNQLGEDNVVYVESRDGIHDFLNFAWFEPERSEVLGVIASWVATL